MGETVVRIHMITLAMMPNQKEKDMLALLAVGVVAKALVFLAIVGAGLYVLSLFAAFPALTIFLIVAGVVAALAGVGIFLASKFLSAFEKGR